MLVNILIGVAAVIALFLVVVATRRAAYHVERAVEIAALPAVVFPVINDLHQFAGIFVMFGKPWETTDPKMEKKFVRPAGVGQSLSWSGNMEAGTGSMTIEKTVPGKMVGIK